MRNLNKLIVTLNIFELRGIIADVLEEKFSRIDTKNSEKGEDVSLISRLEVAKLFGVSKTTIDKWRRCKILPPTIKMSSRIFFNRNQIIEILNRKQKNPNEFLLF
jgi:predicted DNA-binding transcriptional regulator AlpA